MKILGTEIDKITKKNRKRPGHGISSGGGKTAGRGTKGQKSRAGHNIPNQFEGGQTNLSMRLPKLKGFSGIRKKTSLITLSQLDRFYKNNDTVDKTSLIKLGLAGIGDEVKILATGQITKKLTVVDVKMSKASERAIKSVADSGSPEKNKDNQSTKTKVNSKSQKE